MATLTRAFRNYRETIGKSVDVPYIVTEAATEAEVRAACESIPQYYPDADATPTGTGTDTSVGVPARCYLDGVDIEEQVNETTWLVTARYTRLSFDPDLSPDGRYSFTTSGGTQHITQSITTRAKYGNYSSLLYGAIGCDGENVVGCDIAVPVFQWSETHWFYASEVTSAYKQILSNLTGQYNNAAFRGYAAGEVLFMGADGQRDGDDPSDRFEITFKFAASKNRTGLTVGVITGIAKLGWDYMWVQYKADADPTAKIKIKTPEAVYIEQVYYPGDFSALGIGTGEVDET